MSFEVAAGTVAGRTHALAGRGSQDAHVIRRDGDRLVAVVADGCGSGEQSEVGAWMGAHIVATAVERALDEGMSLETEALWEAVRCRSVEVLARTARDMGGRLDEALRRFFLFTVVGLVLSGERAAVFAAGDGLVAVNGEVVRLGPFPGNAPPYIAHGLMAGWTGPAPEIAVVKGLATRDVESVLLATDGAVEMLDLERTALPGAREVVGGLDELWKEDRYFEHPDALRRKLWRMNRPTSRPVWEERRIDREGGLLEDDTTILVVRRKKPASAAA